MCITGGTMFHWPKTASHKNNGNNLVVYAWKLKVGRGIPSEPILYLSGKYHM